MMCDVSYWSSPRPRFGSGCYDKLVVNLEEDGKIFLDSESSFSLVWNRKLSRVKKMRSLVLKSRLYSRTVHDVPVELYKRLTFSRMC